MIDTKLIIVTGISGAGKSTTSNNIARQLKLNGIRCRWLHEEIRRHPIRDGEFRAAPLDTDADFDRNIQDMFRRWDRLMRRIQRAKSVYVMEGMLTENIIRYFFPGNYPEEKILAYYARLLERIAPLNPVIVHLHRADVRRALQSVFSVRGDWWKNLILSEEGMERYLRARQLSGEDGIYTMWENYQALADAAVQQYPGPKIKVDTDAGEWNRYIEQITGYLGLTYYPPEVLPVRHPEQYCGKYAVQVGTETHSLRIDFDGTYLYAQSFWSYMRLLALGGSKFEFASFPIRLAFHKDGAGQMELMDVSGSYDWEIMGTTMRRVME